jgi:hypothetical protein
MNWLKNKRISKEQLMGMLKRIDRAYAILEQNKEQPVILEKNASGGHMFEIRSSKDWGKFYEVDTDIKTCTCPDFSFRSVKCKHIIAAEFASGAEA